MKVKVADIADDFKDTRVSELWNQAEQSGFSKEELNSIHVNPAIFCLISLLLVV